MKYCVLYTQVVHQDDLMNFLVREFPKDRGEIFIPYMEYYMRAKKKTGFMSMFPGYIFLYTDMGMIELHKFFLSNKGKMGAVAKELSLHEKKLFDPDAIYEMSDEQLDELSDLSEDEEKFLDMLRDNGGILTMSYGYEENGKYIVMEGPLKTYERSIQRVDKHNRKAFLNIKINSKQIRAGFECKPKTHWYPKESSNLIQLDDGSEIDLTEFKTRMGATPDRSRK